MLITLFYVSNMISVIFMSFNSNKTGVNSNEPEFILGF
jgi:hypothetical protein